MHRTCAALPVVAALLRSGQSNGLTEAIQERCPRVNAKFVVLAVDAQHDRDRALDVRPARTCCGRVGVPGNAVRLRRYARRNDCCCRSTSRGQKKCSAGGIWRARLWIVVSHRASVGMSTLTLQRVIVHADLWKTKAGKTVGWAP